MISIGSTVLRRIENAICKSRQVNAEICERSVRGSVWPSGTDQSLSGMEKGSYPALEDAQVGIKEEALYVLLYGSSIAGTVILRRRGEEGNARANRLTSDD